MLHSLYHGLTVLGGPAVRLYLDRRRRAGKEDADRQAERFGHPSLPRPAGPLVWVHAASVGEANSVLVLIGRLLDRHPDASVLMTTGTVSSAELMARRLPPRALHQYVPVDLPDAVNRFLDHWRPDLVLWTESEIWPNLLAGVAARGLPAALVNARLSDRSFRRWRLAGGFAAGLLGTFRLILAQTEGDARRLQALGAGRAFSVGNLKFSADPPPAAADAVMALQAACADRPVWLCASTHAGEEELAATVHRTLAARFPRLLTLLAPRHPGRAEELAGRLAALGHTVSRRSAGTLPGPQDSLHLADTMGELGVLYRVAPVVCMGGSFVMHGGQNPVEPAQLGCAVVYGPNMWNFAEITRQLEAAGGAVPVADAAALTGAVARLLDDPAARRQVADAARAVTEENRRVVDRALDALSPLLTGLGAAA